MDRKSYERYKIYKSVENDKPRFEAYAKMSYKCSCGHTITIPATMKKRLCSYCGKWVFKNKKDEFMYRAKEKLKK